MRKIFASKNMIVKIALILALIILIEFTINCRPVQAAGEFGGTLLKPIMNLIVALADGVISITQSVLLGIEDSFTPVDLETSWWNKLKSTFVTWLGPILLIAGAVVATIVSHGAAAPLLIKALVTAGATWGIASIAYYKVTGRTVGKAAFGKYFTISEIGICPESILTNQIDLFNVDFISEPEVKYIERRENVSGYTVPPELLICTTPMATPENWSNLRTMLNNYGLLDFYEYQISEIRKCLVDDLGRVNEYNTDNLKQTFLEKLASVDLNEIETAGNMSDFIQNDVLDGVGVGQLPINPDKYPHLDDLNTAEVIDNCKEFWESNADYYSYNNVFSERIETTAATRTLHKTVGQVYKTIRDICAVALLIVIIYIFIRRIMSVNPTQRNDLTQTLINCFVGLCLIFTMHFVISISVRLINFISTSVLRTGVEQIELNATSEEAAMEELKNININEDNPSGFVYTVKIQELYDTVKDRIDDFPTLELVEGSTDEVYVTSRNFLEEARFRLQEQYLTEGEDAKALNWNSIGWSFVYIILVILTLAFIWLYGKRVVFMAIFTMFAPIVGVMYPLNKMHGEARAHSLNTWFRQFMGNLVMQPLHLFIYAILIGSAMMIAIENPIYVILALMGLLYTEKLLKSIMGLPEDTMGGLGSALRDTTSAIKQGTNLARSAIRTTGRMAGSAVGLGAGVAGAIANKEDGEGKVRKKTKLPSSDTSSPQQITDGSENTPQIDKDENYTLDYLGDTKDGVIGRSEPGEENDISDIAAEGAFDVSDAFPEEDSNTEETGNGAWAYNDMYLTGNAGEGDYEVPSTADSSPEMPKGEEWDNNDMYLGGGRNVEDNERPSTVDSNIEMPESEHGEENNKVPSITSSSVEMPESEYGEENNISSIAAESEFDVSDIYPEEDSTTGNTENESSDYDYDDFDMYMSGGTSGENDKNQPKRPKPTADLDDSARKAVTEAVIVDVPTIKRAKDRYDQKNAKMVIGPKNNIAEVNGPSGVRHFSPLSDQHEISSTTQGGNGRADLTKQTGTSNPKSTKPQLETITQNGGNNGTRGRSGRPRRPSNPQPTQPQLGITTQNGGNSGTAGRPRRPSNPLPSQNTLSVPETEQTPNNGTGSTNQQEQTTRQQPPIQQPRNAEETTDRATDNSGSSSPNSNTQSNNSNEKEERKAKRRKRTAKAVAGATEFTLGAMSATANTGLNIGERIIDAAGHVAMGGSGLIQDATGAANDVTRGAEEVITGVRPPERKASKEKSETSKAGEQPVIPQEAINKSADDLGIRVGSATNLYEKYTKRPSNQKAFRDLQTELEKDNRNITTLTLAAMECVEKSRF